MSNRDDSPSLFQFDKSAIEVGALDDEPNDRAYWMSRTPTERIAALEFLREQFYSYEGAEQQLRRFFEITEPEGS